MDRKKDQQEQKNRKIEALSENPFLNLYRIDACTKSGRAFDYFFASRNKKEALKAVTRSRLPEGMAVYALLRDDPGKLVMVHQYRYPVDGWMYELPAGLIDPGETAQEAAVREMREETGLSFTVYEGGSPVFRNPFFMAQGMTDESGSLVFGYASGDSSAAQQEDSEEIETVFVDRNEAQRILMEERVSMRAGLMLLQFLHADPKEPFAFLDIEMQQNKNKKAREKS